MFQFILVLSCTDKKVPQRNSRAELHSHNNCNARVKTCKLAALKHAGLAILSLTLLAHSVMLGEVIYASVSRSDGSEQKRFGKAELKNTAEQG